VTVTARLPYVSDGEGMHAFTDPVDGERYVSAYLGVDLTQRVFACFDQPDVKATVALTVRADPAWTVLANGEPLEVAEGWWRFATTPLIPVLQVVVCAGPWTSTTWEHDGRTFGWHARRSLAPALEREIDELKRVTTACFDHYGRLFTPPYAFGAYHQIFVPEQNWGAQETPGCVMYQEELLREATDLAGRRELASVIAHEMAHMWFGNLATMRWYEDIWLNESFADFLGYRVADEAAGYAGTLVEFQVRRLPFAYVADGRRSTHPVAATADDVPDSTAAASNFDAISYEKGNALLRQLAIRLGDAAFFAGVDAYLQRFAFANAGLDEFLTALAAAAPGQDVEQWAAAWLRTTGYDTIEVVDGHRGPELRRHGSRSHRLSVVAYDAALSRVGVRQVDVGDRPAVLEGWQEHTLLANAGGETYARIVPRPADDARLRAGLRRIGDPLQRAQVWSTAFLRVHRHELEPAALHAMVREHLAAEPEPAVVRAIVGWALSRALQVCGSPEEVRAGFAAVAAASRAGLGGAGEATAVALTDALVRTEGDPAVLLSWHEQGHVDGRPLSVKQRWVAIWRLAELGAVTHEFVASNTSPHDPADVADWAARATAALPEADRQRQAWSVVRDGDTSNRRVRALLDGLWSPGRGSLPVEQVTAYLAEAPAVAARRGPGVAALLGAAHPGLALAPEHLSALAGALQDELPARLRRRWQDWYDDLTIA
jgi:aminopeptidase N